MSKKVFKGFKQISGVSADFDPSVLVDGYCYLIRTNDDAEDGYIYFNGKKYATANEIKENIEGIETAVSALTTNKQDKLVSGTNIKTINGNSLLGGGDIEISGGTVTGSTREFTPEKLIQIEGVISLSASTSVSDISATTINIAPLKFNKTAAFSLTLDDENNTSYCSTWAGINGRRMNCNTGHTYYIHAAHYLAGDLPEAVMGLEPPTRLTYPDSFGGNRRFIHTSALWPSISKSGDTTNTQIDSEVNVLPGYTGNYYRFMNPYLVWDDCELMKKYGNDFCLHNIAVDKYGPDHSIPNIIRGLSDDMKKVHDRLGRWPKVMAEPDGNATYMDAAKEMYTMDALVNQSYNSSKLYPYTSNTSMYHTVYVRSFDSAESNKAKMDTIMAKAVAEREWFHFCFHSVSDDVYYMLKYLYDNYKEDAWVCTTDEIYEYQHFKAYGSVSIQSQTVENERKKIKFRLKLPVKENFYHKDITINLGLSSAINGLSIVAFDAEQSIEHVPIRELQYKVNDNNDGISFHIGINEQLEENIEYFVSKYEETADTAWKLDALVDLDRLLPAYAAPYRARLDTIIVNPTGIDITASQSAMTEGDTAHFTIMVSPANCTKVADTVITLNSGYTAINKVINGNIITFDVANISAGTVTATATIDEFTDSASITVSAAPAGQLVITSMSLDKSAYIEYDNAYISFSCTQDEQPVTPLYYMVGDSNAGMWSGWREYTGGTISYELDDVRIEQVYLQVAMDEFGASASTVASSSAITVDYSNLSVSGFTIDNLHPYEEEEFVMASWTTILRERPIITPTSQFAYKIWTNLESAPSEWTLRESGSYLFTKKVPITSSALTHVYVQVADIDGTYASDVYTSETIYVQESLAPFVVTALTLSTTTPSINENIQALASCTQAGGPRPPAYGKVWTNLDTEPDEWTQISVDASNRGIFNVTAVTGLTNIYVKVADTDRGMLKSDAFTSETITVQDEVRGVPFMICKVRSGYTYSFYNSVMGCYCGSYIGNVYPHIVPNMSGNTFNSFKSIERDTIMAMSSVTEIYNENECEEWNPDNTMMQVAQSTFDSFFPQEISGSSYFSYMGMSYSKRCCGVMGFSCPNGRYKIKILTSTSNQDIYGTYNYQERVTTHADNMYKFYINGVEHGADLGDETVVPNFYLNENWSNEITVDVTDGKLIFVGVNEKTSQSYGAFNIWMMQITPMFQM